MQTIVPGPRAEPSRAELAALASGSRYAESEPLLAKAEATYALLAQVANEQAGTRIPSDAAPAGDTVMRRWLDDFLAAARGVLPAAPPAAAASLRTRDPDAALAWPAGAEIVTETHPGAANALWERAHRALFVDVLNPDGGDVRLVGAGPGEVACLQEAAALIADVAPELFASVLAHTTLIYLVEGADAFESASDRRLPRAVYVSRAACDDVVRAAEALLHESTHQKLYDLQLVHTLYAPTYDPRTAPTVQPTWHPPGVGWSIDRTVAAAHVYVHLTAFLDQLRRAVPLGYSAATVCRTADQARARADMLLGGLQPFKGSQLNRHGRAFVDWLLETHRSSAPHRGDPDD